MEKVIQTLPLNIGDIAQSQSTSLGDLTQGRIVLLPGTNPSNSSEIRLLRIDSLFEIQNEGVPAIQMLGPQILGVIREGKFVLNSDLAPESRINQDVVIDLDSTNQIPQEYLKLPKDSILGDFQQLFQRFSETFDPTNYLKGMAQIGKETTPAPKESTALKSAVSWIQSLDFTAMQRLGREVGVHVSYGNLQSLKDTLTNKLISLHGSDIHSTEMRLDQLFLSETDSIYQLTSEGKLMHALLQKRMEQMNSHTRGGILESVETQNLEHLAGAFRRFQSLNRSASDLTGSYIGGIKKTGVTQYLDQFLSRPEIVFGFSDKDIVETFNELSRTARGAIRSINQVTREILDDNFSSPQIFAITEASLHNSKLVFDLNGMKSPIQQEMSELLEMVLSGKRIAAKSGLEIGKNHRYALRNVFESKVRRIQSLLESVQIPAVLNPKEQDAIIDLPTLGGVVPLRRFQPAYSDIRQSIQRSFPQTQGFTSDEIMEANSQTFEDLIAGVLGESPRLKAVAESRENQSRTQLILDSAIQDISDQNRRFEKEHSATKASAPSKNKKLFQPTSVSEEKISEILKSPYVAGKVVTDGSQVYKVTETPSLRRRTPASESGIPKAPVTMLEVFAPAFDLGSNLDKLGVMDREGNVTSAASFVKKLGMSGNREIVATPAKTLSPYISIPEGLIPGTRGTVQARPEVFAFLAGMITSENGKKTEIETLAQMLSGRLLKPDAVVSFDPVAGKQYLERASAKLQTQINETLSHYFAEGTQIDVRKLAQAGLRVHEGHSSFRSLLVSDSRDSVRALTREREGIGNIDGEVGGQLFPHNSSVGVFKRDLEEDGEWSEGELLSFFDRVKSDTKTRNRFTTLLGKLSGDTKAKRRQISEHIAGEVSRSIAKRQSGLGTSLDDAIHTNEDGSTLTLADMVSGDDPFAHLFSTTPKTVEVFLHEMIQGRSLTARDLGAKGTKSGQGVVRKIRQDQLGNRFADIHTRIQRAQYREKEQIALFEQLFSRGEMDSRQVVANIRRVQSITEKIVTRQRIRLFGMELTGEGIPRPIDARRFDQALVSSEGIRFLGSRKGDAKRLFLQNAGTLSEEELENRSISKTGLSEEALTALFPGMNRRHFLPGIKKKKVRVGQTELGDPIFAWQDNVPKDYFQRPLIGDQYDFSPAEKYAYAYLTQTGMLRHAAFDASGRPTGQIIPSPTRMSLEEQREYGNSYIQNQVRESIQKNAQLAQESEIGKNFGLETGYHLQKAADAQGLQIVTTSPITNPIDNRLHEGRLKIKDGVVTVQDTGGKFHLSTDNQTLIKTEIPAELAARQLLAKDKLFHKEFTSPEHKKHLDREARLRERGDTPLPENLIESIFEIKGSRGSRALLPQEDSPYLTHESQNRLLDFVYKKRDNFIIDIENDPVTGQIFSIGASFESVGEKLRDFEMQMTLLDAEVNPYADKGWYNSIRTKIKANGTSEELGSEKELIRRMHLTLTSRKEAWIGAHNSKHDFTTLVKRSRELGMYSEADDFENMFKGRGFDTISLGVLADPHLGGKSDLNFLTQNLVDGAYEELHIPLQDSRDVRTLRDVTDIPNRIGTILETKVTELKGKVLSFADKAVPPMLLDGIALPDDGNRSIRIQGKRLSPLTGEVSDTKSRVFDEFENSAGHRTKLYTGSQLSYMLSSSQASLLHPDQKQEIAALEQRKLKDNAARYVRESISEKGSQRDYAVLRGKISQEYENTPVEERLAFSQKLTATAIANERVRQGRDGGKIIPEFQGVNLESLNAKSTNSLVRFLKDSTQQGIQDPYVRASSIMASNTLQERSTEVDAPLMKIMGRLREGGASDQHLDDVSKRYHNFIDSVYEPDRFPIQGTEGESRSITLEREKKKYKISIPESGADASDLQGHFQTFAKQFEPRNSWEEGQIIAGALNRVDSRLTPSGTPDIEVISNHVAEVLNSDLKIGKHEATAQDYVSGQRLRNEDERVTFHAKLNRRLDNVLKDNPEEMDTSSQRIMAALDRIERNKQEYESPEEMTREQTQKFREAVREEGVNGSIFANALDPSKRSERTYYNSDETESSNLASTIPITAKNTASSIFTTSRNSSVREGMERVMEFVGRGEVRDSVMRAGMGLGLAALGIGEISQQIKSRRWKKEEDDSVSEDYNQAQNQSLRDDESPEYQDTQRGWNKLKVTLSGKHRGLPGGGRLSGAALDALAKDVSETLANHFDSESDSQTSYSGSQISESSWNIKKMVNKIIGR